LSGYHITQSQWILYMQSRQSGLTQETSAAKSGVSIRTGRRLERHGQSVKAERMWQTRKDPFVAVWESVLVPLLEEEPTLTGLTLWEYLDDKHYPQGSRGCPILPIPDRLSRSGGRLLRI
jgi:transcriptional regulator with XRE-family HTH domain